jgi:predicted amidohydrolase
MLHTQQPAQTIVTVGHGLILSARDSALEQVCERIVDAGLVGARWVIFPEGCIPGYPTWVWAVCSGDNPLLGALHTEALANAVSIPSDVTDRLCRVAQRAQINVVVGVIERDVTDQGTTFYNTLLCIDAHGQMVGTYRAPYSREATQFDWFPAAIIRPTDEASLLARVGGI